jgi:hypothetical protein
MSDDARPDAPDRDDVMHGWFRRYLAALRTATPGRVERYDPATQLADVQPAIRASVEQPDGSFAYEDTPVVPACPVLWPRVGAWGITMPLGPGDTGLLVACDGAIGHWCAGQGDPQYPGDQRRHHLAHSVFIPGLFPDARALENSGTTGNTNMVLGHDGTGARIELHADGKIDLGGAAVDAAVAQLVASQLTTLKNAISAAPVVTGDGGASFKAALVSALAAWPGNVASGFVRFGG